FRMEITRFIDNLALTEMENGRRSPSVVHVRYAECNGRELSCMRFAHIEILPEDGVRRCGPGNQLDHRLMPVLCGCPDQVVQPRPLLRVQHEPIGQPSEYPHEPFACIIHQLWRDNLIQLRLTERIHQAASRDCERSSR